MNTQPIKISDDELTQGRAIEIHGMQALGCPFCGAQARAQLVPGGSVLADFWSIHCGGGGSGVCPLYVAVSSNQHSGRTLAETINAWNTRKGAQS